MAYCKGQCCGKTKGCQCQEYCSKTCGAIRPGEPKCPYQAVIPSLTVESVSNLKDLADCFVHVSDINTTFYIDDKHRIMTTWAGLVSVDDYDFAANPLNLRGQIAYDAKNNMAAIYDKQGANYIFQISDINNDYMLLEDKPQINGVTLEGNKTSADLGILEADEVALVFDTVADMKLASNLVEGSYAQTLGFHSINDGGGALYKIISTGTANEMDVIAVGSLFANLVIENTMVVNQFGAYGDSTHDDTAVIRAAVNSDASVIQFINGSTYMVTPYNDDNEYGIEIPSNKIVDLCESTVMVITNNRGRYKVFSFKDVSNSSIKNGTIIGDVSTHTGNTGEWGYGISIIHSYNITLDRLYITKCWGDGININFKETENFESNNITITNCICDDNRRQGMSIEAGNNIYVENCKFINTGKTAYTAPGAGVDIEPLVDNKTMIGITFKDCVFKDNHGIQLVGGGAMSNERNRVVKDVTVDNCKFTDEETNTSWVLWLSDIWNGKLINSYVDSVNTIILRPADDFICANNKIKALRINVQTQVCQNSVIQFSNNIFRTPSNAKSTIGFIENYDNNPKTNRNNTIVITDNTMIDKTSGDYVYDAGMVNLLPTQGVDKAIITGNYIEGSKTGISVSCSSVIKDNTIVGTTSYGLTLLTNQVSGTEAYFDIQNNMFYNCGSQSSIIFNYYKKNAIIRNNMYIPVYPNDGIGTTNYPKSAFLTYTSNLTGYTLIENNNIIALTS